MVLTVAQNFTMTTIVLGAEVRVYGSHLPIEGLRMSRYSDLGREIEIVTRRLAALTKKGAPLE
jgi:hypothetical protein